jgi:hypothetical protein
MLPWSEDTRLRAATVWGVETWRDLNSFEFDVWRVMEEGHIPSDEGLVPCLTYMMAALRIPLFLPIPPDAFHAFAQAVRGSMSMYEEAYYHNWIHAFDVAHTVFVILRTYGAFRLFSPAETAGVFLAALCHDLEHPGFNNAYQVNARTELALRFNDQSVLENWHAFRASELLQEHGVLAEVPTDHWWTIRKTVIMTILATDMTCHFGLTDELKSVGSRHGELLERLLTGKRADAAAGAGGAPLDSSAPALGPIEDAPAATFLPKADRDVLLKTVLHAADISNPAKPWEVAKKWSALINEEFFNQGDKERELGLPLSPNFDRATTKPAKLGLNFIDFIVAPLFVALSVIIPDMTLCCELLQGNRTRWQAMLEDDLKEDGSGTPDAKAVERQRWARRKTAFQDVLMVAHDAKSEGSHDGKRASLAALQSFVSGVTSADGPSLPAVVTEETEFTASTATTSQEESMEVREVDSDEDLDSDA